MLYVLNRIGCVLCAYVLLAQPYAWADALDYKPRGKPANRSEGVIPSPVSGYDVELLSARLTYRDELLNGAPSTLKVGLGVKLKDGENIDIVVRELDNRHYYRLDKVTHNWRQAPFEWPAGDVLTPLSKNQGTITMADLGVVAWIKTEADADPQTQSQLDWVAPVTFYSESPPVQARDYLFTFKVAATANVKCEIVQVMDNLSKKLVHSMEFKNQAGRRPFTLLWSNPNAASGNYRVIVNGVLVNGGRLATYSVNFRR